MENNINILINNGNLGRQGKTTIAFNCFKESVEDFIYFTNDESGASIDLRDHIEADKLQTVQKGQDIVIDDEKNTIFDFGGKPDERLLAVAAYVDVILVPIAYQSISELQMTIQNINAFQEVNKNIVIVINNTENIDAEMVKKAIKGNMPKTKVLLLSHSKYIRRLADEEKTILEVARERKGDRTALSKKIIPQLKEIFDVLGITMKDY